MRLVVVAVVLLVLLFLVSCYWIRRKDENHPVPDYPFGIVAPDTIFETTEGPVRADCLKAGDQLVSLDGTCQVKAVQTRWDVQFEKIVVKPNRLSRIRHILYFDQISFCAASRDETNTVRFVPKRPAPYERIVVRESRKSVKSGELSADVSEYLVVELAGRFQEKSGILVAVDQSDRPVVANGIFIYLVGRTN